MAPDRSAPDPDALLARVEDDLAREQPWRARQRLRSWVHQFPAHGDLWRRRLGELLLDAGERPEAGRLLCEAGSCEPSHQPHIAFFLSNKREPAALARIVRRPLQAHLGQGAPLPPALAETLAARGLTAEQLAERWPIRETHREVGAVADSALAIGCGLAILICTVALLLGFAQIFRWLVSVV